MIAPFLPVIAPSLPVQNFHCAVFAELRHVFYIAPFLWTCAWFFCRLGMRPKFWIHESLGMQRDVAPLRNKSLVLWTETELLHWPGEENWGGNFFKLTLAFDLPNLSSRAVQFSKTFVVRLDVFYMWGASFSERFQHLQRFLHVNLPSMVLKLLETLRTRNESLAVVSNTLQPRHFETRAT